MVGRYFSLAGVGIACVTALPLAADGPPPSGYEAEAGALVEAVWAATLTTCDGTAYEVLDDRVVIELDSPAYHLAPTQLTDAARSHGYEHQVTAIASARRWRWGRLVDGRVNDWQPWSEGQDITVRLDQFGGNRAHTLVQDAVLQSNLVRKDGEWRANYPLSPLNSAHRPFDLSFAVSAMVLDCAMLAARN